ncbi:MAG: HlyD family efflux transporter periplasmic adaptor subunit, partial [Sphingobacterium thalpophilum]
LLEVRVISSLEFKREESKYINKKIPLENIASSLLSNGINKKLKQQELKELENQVLIERANFLAKINQLKSEIDNWKMQYLLISKSSGTVIFNQLINKGDWVEANKPLFYIASKDEGKYIGQMKIGQYSLGKVFEGQTVIIRLKAFPYQEYGVLKGKITYLSQQNTSKDSSYMARVVFDNGKLSSYSKELNLKNGLIADADIITNHRSLLGKLFSSMVSLFKNN